MKGLVVFLILLLVGGLVLLLLQNIDIISLINKPDLEHRQGINSLLEKRLNDLRADYLNLENKIKGFSEKDQTTYQNMKGTFEQLENILKEMQEQVSNEIQWRLLRKRFMDKYTMTRKIINGWKFKR